MVTLQKQKYQDKIGDKVGCPSETCGSSDAAHVYSNGIYCYSCQKMFFFGDINNNLKEKRMLTGEILSLSSRRIAKETCSKFMYQRGEFNGRKCQIANYIDDKGSIVAQKVRYPNKSFVVLGDTKKLPTMLYGKHLCPSKGRRVVITEGEIDCLSVSQVFDNKWATVSIPAGAQSAAKAIKANIDWLENFEEVVLFFDNDKPGKDAAIECASLLSPRKARIAMMHGEYKDPNDALVAKNYKAISQAIWNAKPYQPDGILSLEDIQLDTIMAFDSPGYDVSFLGINKMMLGMHKRMLTLLTAGSGVGKSVWAGEIALDLMLRHNLKIGFVALVESVRKTVQQMLGRYLNVPLHLLMHGTLEQGQTIEDYKERGQTRLKEAGVTMEKLKEAKKALDKNLYIYDHFGSLDSQRLISQLKYFITGLGVDFIVLDHISIVLSGQDDIGNERLALDKLMTDLRSLVEQTGVGIIAICHLKKANGKAHEEGGKVSLNDLRGSGGLYQLSDFVVGLERDQQDKDKPNISTIRILKNRLVGRTGEAGQLEYNHNTGRLLHRDDTFDNEEEEVMDDDF